MPIDPLDFLDAPESTSSSNVSSSDSLDFLDKMPKSPPKLAKLGARGLIGAAEVAATPYQLAVAPLASEKAQHGEYRKHVFEDIERLQEQKQAGIWSPEDQQLYNSLVESIKNPEKAAKYVKTVDLGVGSLVEKAAEKAGIDLKEEDAADILATLAGGFTNPRKWAELVKKFPQLMTKEGREFLNVARQEKNIASKWDSLSKSAKGNTEKEGLLNFAKKTGLSPEAATLLTQSQGKVDKLGKIAKKTKKFEGAVKELKEKLGNNYEVLKDIGEQGGFLGGKTIDSLKGDLNKMSFELDKTLIKGPDTKAAKNAIDEAIFKLNEQGGTLGELINTRTNLSQQINWNNIGPKGAFLNKGREIFLKAIEKESPVIAKELKETDKAWAKYEKYKDILDKKQALINMRGVSVPVSDVLLASAIKIGLGASFPATFKLLAAKEGIQRLSTALLVNPKFQGIRKKLLNASLEGAKNKQSAIINVLLRTIKKEDPDLYDELGFDPAVE